MADQCDSIIEDYNEPSKRSRRSVILTTAKPATSIDEWEKKKKGRAAEAVGFIGRFVPIKLTSDTTRREQFCARNKQLVQISSDEAGRWCEVRAIEDEPYFHGYIRRDDSKFHLKKEGQFLIRTSSYEGKLAFILSVVHDGKICHILIRKTRTKQLYWVFNYAFKTVTDLVHYHVRNAYPVDEDNIILKTPAFKEDWQLNHEQIELKKFLGDGNFGEVHSGLLLRSPLEPTVEVAVKMLLSHDFDIKMKTTFLQEANTMLALSHPNIVCMYGVAAARDPIMVVMELCDNSLEGRIKEHAKANRQGPKAITRRERVNLIYGAVKGLEYLHHCGVVHRDIAVRNCLIKKGEAKISDFGLSCVGEHREKKLKNVPVRYLAPEVLQKGRYSFKSDVYSFGIFLWEMYSLGQQPFEEIADTAEVRRRIVKEEIHLDPKEPDMDKDVESLMRRCLSFETNDRPLFPEILKEVEGWPDVVISRESWLRSGIRWLTNSFLDFLIRIIGMEEEYEGGGGGKKEEKKGEGKEKKGEEKKGEEKKGEEKKGEEKKGKASKRARQESGKEKESK